MGYGAAPALAVAYLQGTIVPLRPSSRRAVFGGQRVRYILLDCIGSAVLRRAHYKELVSQSGNLVRAI
jgi:hypothetical protein